MNEFDVICYCILIVGYGAICYTAGKGDLLNLIPKMLQERAKEIEKQLREEEQHE